MTDIESACTRVCIANIPTELRDDKNRLITAGSIVILLPTKNITFAMKSCYAGYCVPLLLACMLLAAVQGSRELRVEQISLPIGRTVTCKGWYDCRQGRTGLTLTVQRMTSTTASGVADFNYADKCKGRVNLQGDVTGTKMKLVPTHWVTKDTCNYNLVDSFSGQTLTVASGEVHFQGTVHSGLGCGAFDVVCKYDPKTLVYSPVYPSKLSLNEYNKCKTNNFVTAFTIKVAAQIGAGKLLGKLLPAGSALAKALDDAPIIPTTIEGLKAFLVKKGISIGPNDVVGKAVEDILLDAMVAEWNAYCKCVWLESKPINGGCPSKIYTSVSYKGYMVYECKDMGLPCTDAGRKTAADFWCKAKGQGPAVRYDVKYMNVPYSILPALGNSAFCVDGKPCTKKAFGSITCS